MAKEIEYIFFDVAGTLLYKPELYTKIQMVLKANGFLFEIAEIKEKHKILSEAISFPDRTNQDFYTNFNAELLFSLGVLPDEELLKKLFSACSYLPWEKFEDTKILSELQVPIGVISNFNSSLRTKLESFFGSIFQNIFVSEELGVAKPAKRFYEIAAEKVDVQPERILYLGDSLKLDVKPALEVGFKPLLIDREDLFPNSKYAISSLLEIKNFLNE